MQPVILGWPSKVLHPDSTLLLILLDHDTLKEAAEHLAVCILSLKHALREPNERRCLLGGIEQIPKANTLQEEIAHVRITVGFVEIYVVFIARDGILDCSTKGFETKESMAFATRRVGFADATRAVSRVDARSPEVAPPLVLLDLPV